MSCLCCFCLFTYSVSSSLQEGSCLVYVVFVCLCIVSPVLCRRDHVLLTLFLLVFVKCLQFFVGGIMSCLRCFCLFTYSVSSSLQEGSCLIYVGFVCLRIVSPVLCRRDHVLFTLFLFVYVQCLQFFVRGIMSCLRCFCLFTYSVSSSLQEGSCLVYVVFACLRIVSPVLCRRDHVLFTLFLFVYVQCLQFFVGGIMSFLRWFCLFTYSVSSSLQEGSCLVYVVFACLRIVSPVLCSRDHVLLTLFLLVYVQCLQFFVGGIMSCLRCFCLFTYSVSSSCKRDHVLLTLFLLVYVQCLQFFVRGIMTCLRFFACLRIVSPVLCRRDHVLFMLFLFVYVQCLQFFVGGIMSCLCCFCLFMYSVSSSLQEGSCLAYVVFACFRKVSPVLCRRDHVLLTLFLLVYVQCLQFFVGGIMSYLRWFCLFTYSVSSSLQEGSCLVYVVFVCLRIVSPVLCKRDHVLFTLFLLVYVQCLQFFVGGIMSCLRCFCLFTYSVSSSLQEGSCLVYVGFVYLRIVSPVLCRRDHVFFTLVLFVYAQCLQFFVGGIMSCLRCFCLFTYSVSSSLQEGSCLAYVVFACLRIVSPVLCRRDHVLFTLVLFVYVQCLQFVVGGIMSCLRWFCLFTYSVSSSLQEGSCLVYVGFVCLHIVSPVLCRRDHVLFTLVLFVYVQCLQFFVGGIMSCLRCFCLFTYSVSSSLQEVSCLVYVVFVCLRIVSPVLCKRDHVLLTLFLLVYVQCLQFFVGGIMSCLTWFCLLTYSVSSSLQEGSCLVYVVFACLRIVSPVRCRRDHVLFTLVLFVYIQCLQFFVRGIMSCLRCFCLFTYSVFSSLQEGSCLVYVVFACLRIVSPVLCRRDHVLFTYSVSSSL